ncbi:oligopeptide:H+ symporter [Endozoicomonas sp. 4G]|uniref:peptide MFS transporter n=1 Tax=Endozoicomonas sp. 4G TaxID=2872754 RepID=UPI0020789BBD|nr:oligopeptide:H+ symporter [Endozoicomonas sp. 4G]
MSARLPGIVPVLILRQILWGAAFYGSFILLTRFFLDKLNYSEAQTIMMLGAFGAIGPVCSAIGGFVADRYIGSFRAVYIGYSFYAIGLAMLSAGAALINAPLSILGIAVIGYSRGLSSTSPTVLFGNSYNETNQDRFQEGLTLNYSLNNLGSFGAKYVFPFILAFVAYQGSFMLSSLIMCGILVLFYVYRKPLRAAGNAMDHRPLSLLFWGIFGAGSLFSMGLIYWVFSNLDQGQYLLYAIGFAAIGYFIFRTAKAESSDQLRMIAILVMMVILICFYFYYGQMMTSMNIYAINLMGDEILGFIPVKPESGVAFNPLWCFILGGPVVGFYAWLEKKGFSFSIPTKFAFAFVFTAIGFSLLALSTQHMNEAGKISANWILMVHFFQAIAELIVGALGAGFLFQMAPKDLSAFTMGMRSIALSLSGLFAARLSTSIALPKDIEFTQSVVESAYYDYFLKLAIFAGIMVFVTIFLSRVINRLVEKSRNVDQGETLTPAITAS